MNPDIKYEIVMIITMTACLVSGFLLRLNLIYIENRSLILDLKLIMLTLKILFIPESTEGFSDEAVQLMRVELGDRNLMV